MSPDNARTLRRTYALSWIPVVVVVIATGSLIATVMWLAGLS